MNAEGIATHAFKTSQIVESLNGVFVKARMDDPYRLTPRSASVRGEQLEERTESIKKWIAAGHPITKYVTRLFQVQVYTHGPKHTNKHPHTCMLNSSSGCRS